MEESLSRFSALYGAPSISQFLATFRYFPRPTAVDTPDNRRQTVRRSQHPALIQETICEATDEPRTRCAR